MECQYIGFFSVKVINTLNFLMSFGFDIFLAKTDDEGDFLRIVSYKEINDVTYEDIERMKKYYDCSCKVIIYGEFVVNRMESKVQICLF